MKIAYYGKNDQETYYINSIKHGFQPCNNFSEMLLEARDLRDNGFLLALEYKQNMNEEEMAQISALL